MTPGRKIALAAALATIALPALAQVPIRDVMDRTGLTISGTVTDVFGNKFVLQDDSGKVLVEAGPRWRQRAEVKPGEKVSVTGRPGDGMFEAFTITLADGKTVEIRPADGPKRPHHGDAGPQGPHGMGHGPHGMGPGPGGMGPAGMGPGGMGPGPRGDGRGPRHIAPDQEKSRTEILDLLRAAGYRDLDDVERKRHHYEVEARNRHGEKVEVHVDFAGNIYREKRDN